MEYLTALIEWFNSTGVPQQVKAVQVRELFTNPWFLVPFVVFVGYHVYRQSVNALVITALIVGLWIFTGTPMMDGLIIDSHLQLGKVIPVAGVFLVAMIVAIYFLFMRSD